MGDDCGDCLSGESVRGPGLAESFLRSRKDRQMLEGRAMLLITCNNSTYFFCAILRSCSPAQSLRITSSLMDLEVV